MMTFKYFLILLLFLSIFIFSPISYADEFSSEENTVVECYENYQENIRKRGHPEEPRLEVIGCFLPAYKTIRKQHWQSKKCWKIFDKGFMYKCDRYNESYKNILGLIRRDAIRKRCNGDKEEIYNCLLSKKNVNYFLGLKCSSDCSGHKAGYEWAKKNNIYKISDCKNNSQSFKNGCGLYVGVEDDYDIMD